MYDRIEELKELCENAKPGTALPDLITIVEEAEDALMTALALCIPIYDSKECLVKKIEKALDNIDRFRNSKP